MKDDQRWWDPISGVTLILIVFLTTYSIESTNWTYDLNRITNISILGVVSGILIGQSNFSKKFSKVLILLYGIAIFLWRFVFALSDEYLWTTRFELLVDRYRSALSQFFANVPLDDGILFLTAIAIIIMILSISIGFAYSRNGKPYIQFAIISSIFISVQLLIPYYRRKSFIFIFYCLLSILLMGRMQYLQQKKRWEASDYNTERDTASYLFRILLIVSVLLSLIAWGVPVLAEKIGWVEKPAYLLSRKNTSNEMINNLLYPVRSLNTKFGDGMFSEIIALGTSRSLDDSPVFSVNPPILDDFYGKFYWKARTYSTYSNGYWKNDGLEFSRVRNVDLTRYLNFSESISSYQFTYLTNRKEIVTPQIVTDINKNIEVAYFSINEELNDYIDFVDYQVIREGEEITILGGYYEFDFDKIPKTKPEYPEWITNRYLAVPNEMSEELKALTEEITRGRSTTFDRAIAVTHFLRNSFSYKDMIEIPKGQEPIEWFLFEGREGFCNYFATSGVLMLRSIGIPARFVVGYSQGDSTGKFNTFEVSKDNSHSWMEVFFPEIGWIIFETTPSEPSLIYFEKEFSDMGMTKRDSVYLAQLFEDEIDTNNYSEVLEASGKLDDIEAEIGKSNRFQWALPILLILIVLLISLIYIRLILVKDKSSKLPTQLINQIRKRNKKIPAWIERWAKYESSSLLEKQYFWIKQFAERLKIIREDNFTPKEFLQLLSLKLPEYSNQISNFSNTYHQVIYSQKNGTDAINLNDDYRNIIRAMISFWAQQKKDKFRKILKRKPI